MGGRRPGGSSRAVIDRTRLERLAEMPACLKARIRGQDHVIDRLFPAIRRAELGLTHPARPRGVFLFVGPTGVGKTELATVMAEFLFGADHLITFDMSEYQGAKALERFIGAGPADAGLFGRAMAKRNMGILLLDEIEKAHPEILDLLLQLTWNGRVTLATGETIDVTPFYLILTSNIGGAESMRMEHSNAAAVETAVLRQVDQALRPELVGRFDERFVFRRLSFAVQQEICAELVRIELARLRTIGFDLEISREALEFITREGHHPTLGVRPMRRTVEHQVQDAAARAIEASHGMCGVLRCDSQAGRLFIAHPA